ncbi:MAG: class I SAM-dependent methyltransferase [Paludibacteraceae bacterium]|nr:class I SAM-dependent methyltransferase [Paludibacteraceae bacterium]
MRAQDLALQRDKYRHLSDEEWRWFLQQVEGRERTADKLPTFAAIDDWWYPVRLSCEQCSSETTARYKREILQAEPVSTMVDLTGGYGVDTYFLSQAFAHADYVEQNEELCRIAEHNFTLQHSSITVHRSSAESFLATGGQYDLIFLDPARRDSHGGKVFRLEDCTPNVVELLPTLLAHLTPNGRLMLKLSPMLDITQAIHALSPVHWDVHVVAVKNEVKEVLLIGEGTNSERTNVITAIDLAQKEQAFVFTREEETTCSPSPATQFPCTYLYEPNAAILKAGAYKLVGERFGLHKADNNTHLYFSDQLVTDFPGRIWHTQSVIRDRKDLPSDMTQANILTRNYPLTPEQLKKKLHLRDGGTAFIIGLRINGKPTLLLAERV